MDSKPVPQSNNSGMHKPYSPAHSFLICIQIQGLAKQQKMLFSNKHSDVKAGCVWLCVCV